MEDRTPNPLTPRAFFDGEWSGEGAIVLLPPFGWLVPPWTFSFSARPTWLSDRIWMVDEEYQFGNGETLRRRMFVVHVSPTVLHVTADDMPLGADIILNAHGFRFSPYQILALRWGRRWRLRCNDVNVVDEAGVVHDRIRFYFAGILVGTLTLKSTVRRSGVA